MNFKFISLMLSIFVLSAVIGQAQLVVTVSPPKIASQKAIVQLTMKNNLTNKVESARAVCFLLDEQGKMVGQATKWVIGQNKTVLEPRGETTFNFVIANSSPFASTNLTAKVSFSHLVLEGGKLANPSKDVTVEQQLALSNQTEPTNNPTVSKPLDNVIASATSRRITIKPPLRTPEAIMVTNLLQPVNPQQH
jgi:hypothetical protein